MLFEIVPRARGGACFVRRQSLCLRGTVFKTEKHCEKPPPAGAVRGFGRPPPPPPPTHTQMKSSVRVFRARFSATGMTRT
jgi:hypothetical protein